MWHSAGWLSKQGSTHGSWLGKVAEAPLRALPVAALQRRALLLLHAFGRSSAALEALIV